MLINLSKGIVIMKENKYNWKSQMAFLKIHDIIRK